jgi:hypothetical protein
LQLKQVTLPQKAQPAAVDPEMVDRAGGYGDQYSAKTYEANAVNPFKEASFLLVRWAPPSG